MPPSLAIEAINHIALPTRRLEESRRFYIDVLGAREISRPAFSFRGSWLYIGGIQIHLIEDQAAPDLRSDINTRERHTAFAVADIDAMEEILRQHGIPYRRNLIPDRQIPQIFFRDPDGHLIEIGTYWAIDR